MGDDELAQALISDEEFRDWFTGLGFPEPGERCIVPSLYVADAAERDTATIIIGGTERYRLLNYGKAIECLRCGSVSHNAHDVRERYCVRCHRFHDDPPPEDYPTSVEFLRVIRSRLR